MHARQHKSAQLIQTAIKKSLIPRNQIATISGLTNTYIRDLEQGNIVNVSREKLISFAVAVNLTLEATDELLTAFDRAMLAAKDIPLFIKTASQKKASNVVNVTRDFFGYELLLLAAESIPGPKTLCTNHLTVILQPTGLRTYYLSSKKQLHPIHLELKEAIGIERKRNLTNQLAHHQMAHYIHIDSLRQYLLGCSVPEERALRQRHMEEVLKYLIQYDNFLLFVTENESGFNFLLKYREGVNSAECLFFYTHDWSRLQGKLEGQIIGFFTGNKVIMKQFKKDADILDTFVIEKYRNKINLANFLKELISESKKTSQP